METDQVGAGHALSLDENCGYCENGGSESEGKCPKPLCVEVYLRITALANASVLLPDNGRPTKPSPLPVDARAMQGIWLLLASLGVFFFASILLYVVYVYLRVHSDSGFTQEMAIPWSFLPSTMLLLGVSICLELAYRAARRDRHVRVRRMTLAACLMGLGFLAVQSDGMKDLLVGMSDAQTRNESVYGYTFILAFLHAAHVVGGVIGLWWTTRNAYVGAYDHERSIGLKFCTLYWHFLDAVWLILLASFWLTQFWINAPAI